MNVRTRRARRCPSPRLLAAAWAAAALAAQQRPAADEPEAAFALEYGFVHGFPENDEYLTVMSGGCAVRRGGIELRAREGIVAQHLGAVHEVVRRASDADADAWPRREAPPPPARRALDEEALARRMAALLAAGSQVPPARAGRPRAEGNEQLIRLVRSIWLAGDVTLMQDGVLVLRAGSLWVSAIDDRLLAFDAELRLTSRDPATGADRYLVLRAAKITRQGQRFVCRDASLTTSLAGEPHFAVRSGEIEVIERGTRFEVRGRDNDLLVHGTAVSALPDIDFFSDEQTPWLIRGASGGYSSEEGAKLGVEIGSTWNRLGGWMHELLTGNPRDEFRGEWTLRPGFNQERGLPLEGELRWRGGEVHEGRAVGFVLDDRGRDRGPVQTRLDGSRIDDDLRSLSRLQSRVHLDQHTALDLELFAASDAAVFSEFFRGEYLESELPETRLHLRHGGDSWLASLSGRFRLDSFAYDDNRRLAPAFMEERPVAHFDAWSVPLLTLPGNTPLLLTTATSVGELAIDADPLQASPPPEVEALRLDQEVELAAPFLIADGRLTVRPFVFGRITFYDDSPMDDSVTRGGYGGGVRLGTRLARTFHWRDGDVDAALRHTVHPEVSFLHRTRVSRSPADVYQFDDVDRLDEDVTIRVGVLNRLQRVDRQRDGDGDGELRASEPVWLDLAQNFKPISERDNGGRHLGLFEYELILRPGLDWPLPGLRFVVEGEHDWDAGKERTFNAGVRFGTVLGLDWVAEYRKDQVRDGVLLYGASTSLWSRWAVSGFSSLDLESDDTLSYDATIVRHDLDWNVRMGIRYDNLQDETSFYLRFEPTLGGMVQPRDSAFAGGLQPWRGALDGY